MVGRYGDGLYRIRNNEFLLEPLELYVSLLVLTLSCCLDCKQLFPLLPFLPKHDRDRVALAAALAAAPVVVVDNLDPLGYRGTYLPFYVSLK